MHDYISHPGFSRVDDFAYCAVVGLTYEFETLMCLFGFFPYEFSSLC